MGNTTLSILQGYDSTGGLVGTWGSPGTAFGSLLNPIGLAFGPNGTLYVAERGNDRVTAFVGNPTPVYRHTWGALMSRYRPNAPGQDK